MKTLSIDSEPSLGKPFVGQPHSIELRGGEQTMGIRTYVPEVVSDESKIVINPIAFSANPSWPSEVYRSSLIASTAGMVTVAVDMPGMGTGSSGLTKAQKKALRRGDWSELGRAQWDAVRAALAERDIDLAGKKVSILGFSMGTSSGIGLMESAPDDVEVADMVGWEGVAWIERSRVGQYLNIGGLAMRMAFSGGKLRTYKKKLSPPLPSDIKRALKAEKAERPKHRNKIASWLLPVVAMAKGRDAVHLRNAMQKDNTKNAKLHLRYGEKSTMSTRKANLYAAKVLDLSGISYSLQSDVDGRHGIEGALYVSVPYYVDTIAS